MPNGTAGPRAGSIDPRASASARFHLSARGPIAVTDSEADADAGSAPETEAASDAAPAGAAPPGAEVPRATLAPPDPLPVARTGPRRGERPVPQPIQEANADGRTRVLVANRADG